MQYPLFFINHNSFYRQTDKIYTKHKGRPSAVTNQPHFHSMPLLSYVGNSSQASTGKNRDTSSAKDDGNSPVENQKSPNGGCHCICCDNFCSCASTNESKPSASCCYLWNAKYMPFLVKLILVALVAVLLIEFLYRKVVSFVENTVAEVRKIDVTTTTKLV